MSDTKDNVITIVESMLDGISGATVSNPKIFKVDDRLRHINGKTYDPEIVSIGPIHYNGSNFKEMEQHKKKFLKKRNEKLNKYVEELRKMEQQARAYYAKSIPLDSDEFVTILLLDGFFVIELVRKYMFEHLRDTDDYIFQSEQVLGQLRHDLLLLENQLPFFILKKLFDMTKTEDPDDNLCNLIIFFVDDVFPWCPSIASGTVEADHLLALVYRTCFPFESLDNGSIHNDQKGNSDTEEGNLDGINCISELKEAGIQFKRSKENDSLNLSFVNGIIQLPHMNVSDKTESILRNVIAYEQFLPSNHPKYMTDYAFFMHCLVNSAKDVEILRRSKIITNWLGDDETVYLMFNRLGRNVPRSSNFCYSDIFGKVNRHCCVRHNTWMANLRRNYFNSPWDYIKFFAGVYLLLLTSGQMVLAVFSYLKKEHRH